MIVHLLDDLVVIEMPWDDPGESSHLDNFPLSAYTCLLVSATRLEDSSAVTDGHKAEHPWSRVANEPIVSFLELSFGDSTRKPQLGSLPFFSFWIIAYDTIF
jgi:hypothetical protein